MKWETMRLSSIESFSVQKTSVFVSQKAEGKDGKKTMTELWGNVYRVFSRLQTSKGSPYRAEAWEIEFSTDFSQGPKTDVSHQQILLLLDCEACSEQLWEFLHMGAANAIVQITNKNLTKAIISLLPNLSPEHVTLCFHRAGIMCKCFSKHQQQQTEIHKSLASIKII